MTWFEDLTGFPEESPDQVREQLHLHGDELTSRVNGKTYTCGRLETPSLGKLRQRVADVEPSPGRLSVAETVADVSDLHADPSNAGCTFQVASQFNLLEMTGPGVTPERGVGIYQYDHTQGPACAIAAGAGTIYRNYFAVVDGQTGQTASRQIDCLAGLGAALGNSGGRLWAMNNGYALASHAGLIEISERLAAASAGELDRLRGLVRIGVQWDTQVTIRGSKHTVTQAYCSALPVAYSQFPSGLWEPFARLVLEAAYQATLSVGVLNGLKTGNRCVYLTLLGAGAFGNRSEWIIESLGRALNLFRKWELEVAVVSYGGSNPHVRSLVEQFP